jgi:hypothetical protein
MRQAGLDYFTDMETVSSGGDLLAVKGEEPLLKP